MRYLLPLAVVLLLLAGCSGQQRAAGDEPRSAQMARTWEERANREIAAAGHADGDTLKRRHYDVAIDDLKKARTLYEDELAEGERGGSLDPNRKVAIEAELDRLSKALEQTIRDRPLGAGM
jgi:hypothetical protein